MLNRSKARRGFTLVEIMIVVAIIGILIAIAVPAYLRSIRQSREKACEESQEKLSGAVMRYALDESTTAVPGYPQLIGVESYLLRTPRCPVDNDPIIIPVTVDGLAQCPNLADYPEHKIDPD